MPKPASKRQRKQKDRNSLRQKKNEAPAWSVDRAANDAFDEVVAHAAVAADGLEDSNALVLPAKRKAAAQLSDSNAASKAGRPLSKAQARKLRKVQEEKEKRLQRTQVLATLSSHALDGSATAMLRSSAMKGAKETKRQALRRALALQRAGLAVPDGVRLLQQRPVAQQFADGTPLDSDDESSPDDAAAGGPVVAGSNGGHRVGASNAVGPGSGTEQEEEEEGEEERVGSASEGKDKGDGAQRGTASAEEQAAVLAAARRHLQAQGHDVDSCNDTLRAVLTTAAPQAGAPVGPARVVPIQRPAEVEESRRELPIVGMEQEVMEAIAGNDVIVLAGATGCGKTTQVPQFLYEAGYGSPAFADRCGRVGVTQPRRVAATSTAKRVAAEMGSALGQMVGYQVRYDKRMSGAAAIKFMTDGILLRELQEDFLLSQYSVIVVDEAHERSLNTDLLLGMLSRIVPLRRSMALQGAAAGVRPVGPLKLVIMSATLRTEDFVSNSRLFPMPPPVVTVPARQFPVTVHFSRRTELHDFVGAAYNKVCRIHRELPPGGVLVFLEGQRSVEGLCSRLRAAFPMHEELPPGTGSCSRRSGGSGSCAQGVADGREGYPSAGGEPTAADVAGVTEAGEAEADPFSADAAEAGEAADAELAWENEEEQLQQRRRSGAAASSSGGGCGGGRGGGVRNGQEQGGGSNVQYVSEEELLESGSDEEEVVVLGGEGFSEAEIKAAEARFEEKMGISLSSLAGSGGSAVEGERRAGPLWVLPLYAMLHPEGQARVFEAPPPGARLVVVATNVAETSLTIPGIRYVVDAGRSKQKLLSGEGGAMSNYHVRWVSKASAEQRAGRAGRTGPGHCYRLYSSAHFNDTFPQHTPPEILNTPLEGVVLLMKAMHVDKVGNFPFPTPPARTAVEDAERCLVSLSALEPRSGALTHTGSRMARLPVTPRHARMLVAVADGEGEGAAAARALPLALGMAAALSVDSPFQHIASVLGDAAQRKAAREVHDTYRVADSDALSALRVLAGYEAARGDKDDFCRRNFLHARVLREMASLHRQLALAMAAADPAALPPSAAPAASRRARAAALAALPTVLPGQRTLRTLRRALAAGWADRVARRARSAEYIQQLAAQRGGGHRAVRYTAAALEGHVFLRPDSALRFAAPEYCVYTEVTQTEKRAYMSGVTAVEGEWLAEVAPQLAAFTPPLGHPPPCYSADRDAVLCWRGLAYGRHEWQLPPVAVPHPDMQVASAAFASALLGGRVLPAAAALAPCLAAPAALAARPDAIAHLRVAELLAALQARRVASRAALAGAWREDPGYLRRELGLWMKKGSEQVLDRVWAQLLAEAAAGAEGVGRKKRSKGGKPRSGA